MPCGIVEAAEYIVDKEFTDAAITSLPARKALVRLLRQMFSADVRVGKQWKDVRRRYYLAAIEYVATLRRQAYSRKQYGG